MKDFGVVIEEMMDRYALADLSFEYRHVTVIMDKKGNILSMGTNMDRKVSRASARTRHSEMDAINKFLLHRSPGKSARSDKYKLNKPLYVLIIRISRGGGLKMSKPCRFCLDRLTRLELLGYKIKHIYYSDRTGTLIKSNLSELKEESTYLPLRERQILRRVSTPSSHDL